MNFQPSLPPGFSLRVLSPEEVPSIEAMLVGLADHHNGVASTFSGWYPVRPIADTMSEISDSIEKGVAIVFALYTGESRMVGVAMGSISNTLGELDFLYLEPHIRGGGLGRTLVEAVLSWLRNAGATLVDLRVVAGNEAKIFYERLGFTVRTEILSMELDGGGAAADHSGLA